MARYCIFRTDRIGDVVLTLPMAEALKAHDRRAHVTFCVQEYTAPLVALCPFVDDIISIPDRDLTPGNREFAQTLRARDFGTAIFAYPRPRLAAAARRAAIPIRVGTAFRMYSLRFTHRVREHRNPSLRHECDYNLNLLRQIDIPIPDNLLPRLDIPDILQAGVRDIVAASGIPDRTSFGILHPGSGGSAKEWPPERFSELARMLISSLPDMHLLLTGTTGERGLMEAIHHAAAANGAGHRVHILFDAVSLDQLTAILASSRFCVANSTGPLHIAAAVGTPVLGLYPFERVCHPRRWGPLGPHSRVLIPEPDPNCPDCRRDSCPMHDDMRRISAEDAHDALLSCL
ncbi:MAG: glycosyltransferase family 9 protein [Bacteroidetes bacterium]|nr:glycosyltransferase family 9 protein [Bacteroidota bacterium]